MAEPLLKGPELDPRRVDALWQKAAPQVSFAERARRTRRRLVMAGGVVAIALAFAVMERAETPTLEPGTSFVASDRGSSFTLRDGSSVEAEPATAIVLTRLEDKEIGLELSRGKAQFADTKKPSRRFVVRVADVTVTVVGTRFSIARQEERVEVLVEEGLVEVEHGGEIARLGAGERWARPSQLAATKVETPVAEAPVAEAEEIVGAPAPVGRPRAQGRAPIRRAEADCLFEAALAARRSGDGQAALVAFRELLGRHPDHPRAALASFELGRLEMDVAHDAGQESTCGIRSDHSLWCWSTDVATNQFVDHPIQEGLMRDFGLVRTDAFHLCALKLDGALFCKGRGIEGRLGRGDTEPIPTLVEVSPGRRFSSVSIGRFHTCARDVAGAVLCTGKNDNGELGVGDNARRNVFSEAPLP